jgi:hypothetical protein
VEGMNSLENDLRILTAKTKLTHIIFVGNPQTLHEDYYLVCCWERETSDEHAVGRVIIAQPLSMSNGLEMFSSVYIPPCIGLDLDYRFPFNGQLHHRNKCFKANTQQVILQKILQFALYLL